MRKPATAILLIVGLATTLMSQRITPRTSLPSAISENALRAHIKFLSDDRLEGRGTGARGGELAALYVAEQFEAMGLKGAAPRGVFGSPYRSLASKPIRKLSCTSQTARRVKRLSSPMILWHSLERKWGT